MIDETHDAGLRSWVESANRDGTPFPMQNLPHGVFRRRASGEAFRGGVAIGDAILDMAAAHAAGLFSGQAAVAAAHAGAASLNGLMALGAAHAAALRLALSRLLRAGAPGADALARCLVPQDQAEYAVPARIGDYTDFYTSVHHATNIGRLFRPDNPLMPNFKWIPIGYHGRASSITVSDTPVRRPRGQLMPPGASQPLLAPCKRLDYEMELGIWVGRGNALGSPVPIDEAEDHVFGMCLLNDWSARDIQSWEYQPLGPFLAKNFATTISPWIVTLQALAPYRCEWTRAPGEPQPLAYLDSAGNRARGAFDLALEVWLETPRLREQQAGPVRLTRSSFRHSYWTVAQMVAHHTIGGCNLQPGDLFGSGTQSGPTAEEGGALIELTAGGSKPITLPDGETRSFLEDGDAVILRAWCEKPGFARIGFGDCRGTVLPATQAA